MSRNPGFSILGPQVCKSPGGRLSWFFELKPKGGLEFEGAGKQRSKTKRTKGKRKKKGGRKL